MYKNIPDAIVIGGGLAGTSIANNLARRGVKVTILEKNANIAQETSGQIALTAHPILHKELTPKMLLSLLGFSYLREYLSKLQKNSLISIFSNGVFQIASDKKKEDRFKLGISLARSKNIPITFYDDKNKIKEISNIGISKKGIFFSNAFSLSPYEFCQANIKHKRIRTLYHKNISQIQFEKTKKLWQLYNSKGNILLESPILILACAYYIKNFPLLKKVPLKKIRGQNFLFNLAKYRLEPKCTLTYDGYIIPKVDSKQNSLIGASFEESNFNINVEKSQNLNLYKKFITNLENLCNNFEQNLDLRKELEGAQTKVAFRTTTPDRMPVCGELQEKNLYVKIAYGSYGLTFAPILSEYLATKICNEKNSLLPEKIIQAISPNRYFK